MKKLVISRKDLKNNLKEIRRILYSDGKYEPENMPKIIAVVKGNGMGLGLVKYSKFLVNQGIDFLAVANFDEAMALRKAKIQEEILLLTPIIREKEIEPLILKDITLTVSSLEQLKIIEKVAKKINKTVNAHLKIDTGFGRYGILSDNRQEILEVFHSCEKVQITGTYTHFSKPIDEKFTNKQFNKFLDVIAYLKTNGQDPGMLHCSESTAFLKYKLMNLNAVRIGSALQGRVLVKGYHFKEVGIFKSEIQEIKNVPKGYNISYGNMYKTKREMKIAVVPVGFMDGLNIRNDRDIFSFKENLKSVGIEIKKIFKNNSKKVMINEKKYSIIGRIGMYHCIVDITNSENIEIGDEVILEIPPMRVNSTIRREYR